MHDQEAFDRSFEGVRVGNKSHSTRLQFGSGEGAVSDGRTTSINIYIEPPSEADVRATYLRDPSLEGFATFEEYMAAMEAPEYNTSSVYRGLVAARRRVSKF